MLRSVKELFGYSLSTADGQKGKVADFYFDDWVWTIRYLVADTGPWLLGRLVLISPTVFDSPNWKEKIFSLNLTRQQIENSPPIDADKPVSRQKEMELTTYYQWMPYWTEPGIDAAFVGEALTSDAIARYEATKSVTAVQEKNADPHLQSAKSVLGYHVEAKDGEIGHVEDFIVDDDVWAIRYVIVNTRNWLAGKKVILAAEWLTRVEWEKSRAFIPFLSKKQIEESPLYEGVTALNRKYESQLFNYYGRPYYWK